MSLNDLDEAQNLLTSPNLWALWGSALYLGELGLPQAYSPLQVMLESIIQEPFTASTPYYPIYWMARIPPLLHHFGRPETVAYLQQILPRVQALRHWLEEQDTTAIYALRRTLMATWQIFRVELTERAILSLLTIQQSVDGE